MKRSRRAVLTLLAMLGGCGQPSGSESAVEHAPTHAPEAHQAAEGAATPAQVELSPADGPLLTQLAAHVRQALELDRTPAIYVHASWCEPCLALDRYAQDPSMVAAFEGTHIARVDLDLWSAQLEPFGLSGSIPAWAGLDADGRPTRQRIDGGAWGENIPANMAGPLGAYFQNL